MRPRWLPIVYVVFVVLAVFVVPLVAGILWLGSRPSWLFSASNSPEGVVVQVYRGEATEPTYTALLNAKTIPSDIDRVRLSNLPADIGTTTFADETVRPGRWTLRLADTELDIMERAMIIDGKREIAPKR